MKLLEKSEFISIIDEMLEDDDIYFFDEDYSSFVVLFYFSDKEELCLASSMIKKFPFDIDKYNEYCMLYTYQGNGVENLEIKKLECDVLKVYDIDEINSFSIVKYKIIKEDSPIATI